MQTPHTHTGTWHTAHSYVQGLRAHTPMHAHTHARTLPSDRPHP